MPFSRQQVVLDLLADPRLGHVGNGQEQAGCLAAAIIELLGVEDKPAARLALLEVHLIGFDRRMIGERGIEQRAQLRHIPFAFADSGQLPSGYIVGIEFERLVEGGAGGDDSQILVEQQCRGCGRGYDCEREIALHIGMSPSIHGRGPFRGDRRARAGESRSG